MDNKKDHKKQEEKKCPEDKEREIKQQDEAVESLKRQLAEREKTLEDITDSLKRLQAEFENFSKRMEKERLEFIRYANAGFIFSILPVIDSLEIALKNTADKEKFIQGMKMIYAQLHSILNAEGLKPIDSLGHMFDPYRHEVLMKEESDKPEGTILEEFQKGYMLKERVIRHSKVKVSGK